MMGLANRMKQMAGRLPGASLLLAAMAIALWFAPAFSSWCEWDRRLPWQLWRWLTGHFCHWSAEHLVWDVVVFLFLGAWCERHSRRQFLICTVAAAGAICIATALFLPEIQSYRGLSGLDSALFGWLSVELLRSARAKKDWRTVSIVLLFALAFTAKVALECLTASTLFVSSAQSGFVPVPLAHAVGIVAGICSNLFPWTPRLSRNNSDGNHGWTRMNTDKSPIEEGFPVWNFRTFWCGCLNVIRFLRIRVHRCLSVVTLFLN